MRIESEHPELVGFGGRGCFCGGGTFLPNASLCNYFSGMRAGTLFSRPRRGCERFASWADGLRACTMTFDLCGRFSLDVDTNCHTNES